MLYHKDCGIPRWIYGLIPSGVKNLVYSRHATQAMRTDKYGSIKAPTWLKFAAYQIVEITVIGKKIDKMVLRSSYSVDYDIVLVVQPTANKSEWFVKTIWLNEKSDNHATLDKSRFANA